MMKTRKGFSLVEMLTVVVLIMILVGFIMPVINKAREKAKCARCAANLKQLHEAAMNYATDNAILPYAVSCESLQPDGSTWAQCHVGWIDWTIGKKTYWDGTNGTTCIINDTLYPYVMDKRIYVCPTFQWKTKTAVRSYGMNAKVGGANAYAIINAVRYLMFADQALSANEGSTQVSGYGLNSATAWNVTTNTDKTYNRETDGMIEARDRYLGTLDTGGRPFERIGSHHDQRANCIFVDGHVEKIHYTNTVAICDGTWTGID